MKQIKIEVTCARLGGERLGSKTYDALEFLELTRPKSKLLKLFNISVALLKINLSLHQPRGRGGYARVRN